MAYSRLLLLSSLAVVWCAKDEHIWDMGPQNLESSVAPQQMAPPQPPQMTLPKSLNSLEDPTESYTPPNSALPNGMSNANALPRGHRIVHDATLNDLEDGESLHVCPLQSDNAPFYVQPCERNAHRMMHSQQLFFSTRSGCVDAPHETFRRLVYGHK